jgi:N-acetylmuramoyl-L-alanine amidase
MSFLADLGVIDIRDKLPRANWSIGTRTATTSLTWHYNGPAVDPSCWSGARLMAQLIADAHWQMHPGWGGTVDGADGLMYHLIVAGDGAAYQARDLDALLWHCAHADGNAHGLALHFPLGTNQAPTAAQLATAFRVSDALRAQFSSETLGVWL